MHKETLHNESGGILGEDQSSSKMVLWSLASGIASISDFRLPRTVGLCTVCTSQPLSLDRLDPNPHTRVKSQTLWKFPVDRIYCGIFGTASKYGLIIVYGITKE